MAGGAHPASPDRMSSPHNHQLSGGSLCHAHSKLVCFVWRSISTFLNFPRLSIPVCSFQVLDLGEPVYNHATESGCRPQKVACSQGPGGCGLRGQCMGGLKQPRCECDPGWTGPGCATPTVPARLASTSYMKLALSFTPGPRVVRVQVRVRLRGARSGLLLQLAAHHRAATFTLHVSLSESSLFRPLTLSSPAALVLASTTTCLLSLLCI